MAINHQARQDYERAVSKGFWRKILTRLTGESNKLLPFDEVRERLPIRGQHYAGLQHVEVDKIIGSLGRYRDFDRVFLPTQRRTKERWVSIDLARHEHIPLPPVALIKVGDVYFVKDGHHRISVAREHGQDFVDAYVVVITTPVRLTPDISVDDLASKQEYVEFLEKTGLEDSRPGADLEMTIPGLYRELSRHIDVHRWYLGEQRNMDVSYQEAASSWYDLVYLPLAQFIKDHDILKDFPGSSQADLYLWIMEYQDYLRQAFEGGQKESIARAQAASRLVVEYPIPVVEKLIRLLQGTNWLEEMILAQERADFLEKTCLNDICPDAEIVTTAPGQYDLLREHIDVHRWYLGENLGEDISYEKALTSWYGKVYLPLVDIIREQKVLDEFPGRTETDLYLWIINHQWYLREAYGDEIPLDEVAEAFADDVSEDPVKKVVKTIKKVTGMELERSPYSLLAADKYRLAALPQNLVNGTAYDHLQHRV